MGSMQNIYVFKKKSKLKILITCDGTSGKVSDILMPKYLLF